MYAYISVATQRWSESLACETTMAYNLITARVNMEVLG